MEKSEGLIKGRGCFPAALLFGLFFQPQFLLSAKQLSEVARSPENTVFYLFGP